MLPETTQKLHSLYMDCACRISTDTRNIEPGSMFFCLKGANFNGNLFAKDALDKGAAWVVADQEDVCTDPRILFVNDTLLALQDLAHFHREHIDTQILAIGGSNGKTTTKELCTAVLGSTLKVKATRANLNNHIGVPLTLLSLDGTEDVGIIELGTNHPGEMKLLCDITAADAGIITNIGKEHLEGFGSLEAVAREESEVFLSLIFEEGTGFVNADDSWVANMSKRLPSKFSYGIQNEADLKGEILDSMPSLKFRLHYQGKIYGPYTSKLGGAYNLYNILAAISSGLHYGVSLETAAVAACAYTPSNNRSEWKTVNGKQVWMDAYNANPSSMELALKEFSKLPGTKAAFLGDMLELGTFAKEEHENIVRLCRESGIETYYSGAVFYAANQANPHAFLDTDALVNYLKEHTPKAENILIKGSRGMRMERVLEAI